MPGRIGLSDRERYEIYFSKGNLEQTGIRFLRCLIVDLRALYHTMEQVYTQGSKIALRAF